MMLRESAVSKVGCWDLLHQVELCLYWIDAIALVSAESHVNITIYQASNTGVAHFRRVILVEEALCAVCHRTVDREGGSGNIMQHIASKNAAT